MATPSVATGGNDSPLPPVTRQLFLTGGMVKGGVALLHPDVIAGCKSATDAIGLSMQVSTVRHTQGRFADLFGNARAHFSRMLNGSALLAVDPIRVGQVTRNAALVQWWARQLGYDLVPHVETEREELERLRREVGR